MDAGEEAAEDAAAAAAGNNGDIICTEESSDMMFDEMENHLHPLQWQPHHSSDVGVDWMRI